MRITKLNKSTFKSSHVLYMIRSDDLGGLYYIGVHTCTGSAYNCSQTKCNYKGSSSVISDLVQLQPEARWVMTALAYAADRRQLKELEELHLSLHIGNPKCLNIKTSGQLMPQHTEEGKERIRQAARSTGMIMIRKDLKEVYVPYDQTIAALLAGYRFKRVNIKLKHYDLKVVACLGTPMVEQVLPSLLADGWLIGEDRRLTKINADQFWELAGYKVERIQINRAIRVR